MDLESEILWPELGREQPLEIDSVDAHRAQEYSLLAMLLSRSPDAATLDRIAKLRGDATPLGLAHLALAQAAGQRECGRDRDASTSPFSSGLDAASCFPTDHTISPAFSTNGRWRDCAKTFARYGIERTEGQVEPEDHAATLCEIMAGMASGQFPVPDTMQRRFFEKHLASWIGRFFVDLERAEAAEFYRQVGSLGRLFLETETEAFMLPLSKRVTERRRDAYELDKTSLGTSSVPSCAWRRSGGRRRVSACSGGESR